MTEGFIIAIIILACVICTFCICLITFDFVLTNRARRQEMKANKEQVKQVEEQPSEKVEEEKPIETPVEEDVSPKEVEEISVEASEDEDVVSFAQVKKETFREKYQKMDRTHKNYCDEIEKKALSVENSKKRESNNHVDVKVGSLPVVRILIRRDVLTCEFQFANFEFKAYSKENGVKYKAAPISIKVVEENDYQAVLDTIDIAAKAIDDEKAYKKELKKKAKEENAVNV